MNTSKPALDLASETGNRHGQASAYLDAGAPDGALGVFIKIGNRLSQANALLGLGEVAWVRGDDRGRAFLAEAAELYEAIGLADKAANARQRIHSGAKRLTTRSGHRGDEPSRRHSTRPTTVPRSARRLTNGPL